MIDRVGVGRGRANTIDFYSLCFIRNVSECLNGGPIKRVTYFVDYFDYNLFGISLVNALTRGGRNERKEVKSQVKVKDRWRERMPGSEASRASSCLKLLRMNR
jgi:hypothetical protein